MTSNNKVWHLNIFRRWYFWAALSFISMICCYFNWIYFPKVHPILNINIISDKAQIQKLSKELCKKYNLGPEYYTQISHFVSDKNMENYIEQNATGTMGKDGIEQYIRTNPYQIYTWQIRHFKENDPKECLLKFTPDGILYGFIEQISETEPGPTLTSEEALKIAENFTTNEWNINLENYNLVESSHEQRSNGRTDYTFIFEEKKDSSTLNYLTDELKYGLIICVYGNKVSCIDHFVETPEIVSNYQGHPIKELTDSLSSITIAFTYLLYVIMCFIGLLILLITNYLIKNSAIIWGILLALAQFIFQLSGISDIWVNYHISQSAGAYLVNNILGYIVGFLFYAALYSLIIMIAEGLTRAAFPKQIQLWKFWNKQASSSPTAIGIVIGSYLLAILYLTFATAIFVFSPNLFGWPYINLISLNSTTIGHFAPGLSVLAKSITEGFWKEMLFRAIPIAFFTLIGQKIGFRKIGLTLGFILQIFIVAIANSSYLTLPSYIGFIEPLISSFFFGLLYINFGLMPGIIIQFVYNVILLGLPLFKVTDPSMLIQKIIIILGMLAPLIILLINLIRTRKISELSEKYLNISWTPTSNNYEQPQEEMLPKFGLSISKIIILTILVTLSCSVIFKNIDFNSYEPKFNITRDQAIEKAKECLTSKEIFLDSSWETLSRIIKPSKSTIKYIWQNFGEEVYKKLNGNYIKYPAFEIKFTKFAGFGYQRAEEYTILINTSGKIESCQHILPEDFPGKSLSESNANHLAISVASEQYKLDPTFLKIISSVEIKRPNRKDWIITINDTSIDYIGSAQAHIIVKICGDEITSINRKIHTPTEWLSYKSRLDQFSIIFELLKEIMLFLVILLAFFQLLQTSKSKASIIASIIVWLSYLGLIITNTLLAIPEITAHLNTAKSFYFQIMYMEFLTLAKEILKSFSILILAAYIFNKKHEIQNNLRTLGVINISLGIIAIGFSTILLLLYKNMPISYSFQYLNSYNPMISFVITNLVLFISRTLTILFIAQYAKFKFNLRTIFAAVATALFILSGLEIKDLSTHLLVFAIIFIIILISHLAIIRYNPLFIPIILLTLQITHLAEEYTADPFINSQHIIAITISILIIAALLITFLILKLQTKKALTDSA